MEIAGCATVGPRLVRCDLAGLAPGSPNCLTNSRRESALGINSWKYLKGVAPLRWNKTVLRYRRRICLSLLFNLLHFSVNEPDRSP
jgi:hypothetical protein